MATSQHSRLAMKAARRMARSDQKQKVGRSVCRHLLLMIEDSQATPVPRPGRKMLQVGDTRSKNRIQFSLGL
jgi:hypothetical protein